ncbi:MAG: hypothetical protein IJ408_01595 [Clostridia bacterium]|nr:hypothetical protein [Clostridia bacterium]
MKKIFAIIMLIVLSLSLCSCEAYDIFREELTAKKQAAEQERTETYKAFYDEVSRSKVLIDSIASEVCAVWKDSENDTIANQTQKINQLLSKHADTVNQINERSEKIDELFKNVKALESENYYDYAIEYSKDVMRSYVDYKDLTVNANPALDSMGYIAITAAESTLEENLQYFYVEM